MDTMSYGKESAGRREIAFVLNLSLWLSPFLHPFLRRDLEHHILIHLFHTTPDFPIKLNVSSLPCWYPQCLVIEL